MPKFPFLLPYPPRFCWFPPRPRNFYKHASFSHLSNRTDVALVYALFFLIENVKSLRICQAHLVEIAPAGTTTVSASAMHVASVHWLSTVHASASVWEVAHATSGRSSSRHHVSVGGSSTAPAKVATAWEAASVGGRWKSASGRPAVASTGTRH